MPRSRAGWRVARFPNNNRAGEKPLLIPLSKSSPLDGKLAATISLSCIENWSPVATLTRIIECMSSLFACAPEGKKNASRGCDLSPSPLSSRQATFLAPLVGLCELETDEQETLITLRQRTSRNRSGLRPRSAVCPDAAHAHRRTARRLAKAASEPARSANYKALW